ncbi:MAG: Crp/Fnr family transcriptional regulator [Tabrizicola sp.]|jgi:CRP/FNR family transcriptional regulator|nr:Crp/Fnr family transcriptional regulator [Tabrizicola sp.]
MLEDNFVAEGSTPQRAVAPFGAGLRNNANALRCGLPLGIPTACGDLRNRQELAPDSEVISGTGRSRDVWFVRTGILRLQRYSYDGQRQILSLYLPGDFVGYDGRLREDMSVETVTQSGLCRLGKRSLDALFSRDRALYEDFLQQQQGQLDWLHWLTWSLGALGPEERLSAFLALSCRFMPYQPLPDGSGILSVVMPRTDIADLLATSVETICRTVHKLAETGVIEIRDPSHFRILDLGRLTALGQVVGSYDRLTRGIAERKARLIGLEGLVREGPACFCGR